MGALTFAFIEPEQAKEWVDEYYRLIQSDECVPAGFAVNPNFAIVLPMMLHKDEATAIERGIDGAHFFGFSLAHYYVFGDHRPGITNVWDEFQAKRADYGFTREIINADDGPLGVKILEQGFGSLRGAIGTPEQVIELVERYRQAGVDQVIFVQQAARTSTSTCASRSSCSARRCCRTSSTGASSDEADKRERLAEACEQALARRAPARAADPGLRDHAAGRADVGAGDRRGTPGEVERSGQRRAAHGEGRDRRPPATGRRVAVRRLRARPLRRAARAHRRLQRGPADDLQGDGARVRAREGERVLRRGAVRADDQQRAEELDRADRGRRSAP